MTKPKKAFSQENNGEKGEKTLCPTQQKKPKKVHKRKENKSLTGEGITHL